MRALPLLLFTDEEKREDHGQNANRKIDKEDQLPANVGHQITTQGWADRGRQQHRNAEYSHSRAALRVRERAEEQRHRERHQCRAAQTLENTKEDQQRQAP